MDPKAPIYRAGSKQQHVVYAVALVSAILAVLTFVAVVYVLYASPSYGQGLVTGLAAFWVIWPPLWFYYEYFWLYRSAAAPDSFEMFKHGQQVAVAIWAGISLTLSGLAASDFVRPGQLTLECKSSVHTSGESAVFSCHRQLSDESKPVK
ncbi:MAG TPA: hypothetical protein VF534_31075 [Paraburkholderia sp.]